MTMYVEEEVQLRSFLTSALDAGESLTSFLDPFTPGTCGIVGSSDSLDATEKTVPFVRTENQTPFPDPPISSLNTIPTELPRHDWYVGYVTDVVKSTAKG
jgi:hypothetical protein